MKQTCGSVREWLGAFSDGEIDPARTEQVSAHLETCAGCRRELDQIQELHKLTKSVEHPRLAEDYWDWHRTKVWHGIRNRKRAPAPSYRPSFAWPKLATAAAGLVVVMVVVIVGWRTLLERPGTAGRTLAERQTKAEAPVAAVPVAKPSTAGGNPEASAGAARVEAEGRSDELAQSPVATGRDAEKTNVGYAAKGGGATGVTSAAKPAAAPLNRPAPETKLAARESDNELASAPATAGQRLRASSGKQRGRIVSGPVLLESPPLADADALDTGTVLLNVKTDSAGRVLSAGVRRSSGSPRLDSVAMSQIRQSRFKAAVKNKRSVPSSFAYPYRFQKKQAKPQEEQMPHEKQVEREEQKPQTEPKLREEHKLQQEQNQPAQDDKSQQQDSGKQAAPVKEKTKK
jgi:TonB family protein